jgi:hypothetical protein
MSDKISLGDILRYACNLAINAFSTTVIDTTVTALTSAGATLVKDENENVFVKFTVKKSQ